MKTKIADTDFVTTEKRVLIKAIGTFLVEKKVDKTRVIEFAYALDSSLENDPIYGRSVENGPANIYKRFDRWKYTGSVQETYRYLPLVGVEQITNKFGPEMLKLSDNELPGPLTKEDTTSFFGAFADAETDGELED